MTLGIKKTATIMILIAGATLTTACVDDRHRYHHEADVGVSVGFDEVAFGYRDGYWDRHHQWHSWAHQDDATRYRTAPRNSYHDWDHTRDPDQGWHDDDHR